MHTVGATLIQFDPMELGLTVDWVLQAQGADAAVLRSRRRQVVEIAERAFIEGLSLLEPRALIRAFDVSSLNHQQLSLRGGSSLAGTAISQHLAGAQQVAVVVYTSGAALEKRIQQVMVKDAPFAFALDGVGNAVNEALSLLVYRHVSNLAAAHGWQTSLFLNPGMIGWSVEQGQPQIFSLVNTTAIGISVNAEHVMHPRKSTSGVIGLGPDMVPTQGPPCEYCSLNETCRYKGRQPHGVSG